MINKKSILIFLSIITLSNINADEIKNNTELLNQNTIQQPDTSIQTLAINKKNFDLAKQSSVKVEIEDINTHSKSSLGSGFFIDSDGHLITNYHVISSYLFNPLKYKIVIYNELGFTDEAYVKGFDLNNDLTLLATKKYKSKYFLPIKKQNVVGEKLYSFGYPLNIGFTMAEGTGNDIPVHSITPRYVFSGSINSGMSGGQVLNSEGEVIGVNVASITGLQISFIVPIKFVELLYSANVKNNSFSSITKKDIFIPIIRQQYEDFFKQWFERISKSNQINSLNYGRKINIIKDLDCWGKSKVSDLNTTNDIEITKQMCSYDDYIFIKDKNNLEFLNTLITKIKKVENKNDAFQLLTERITSTIQEKNIKIDFGEDKIKTDKICQNHNIQNSKNNFYATTCIEENIQLKEVYKINILLTDYDNLFNVNIVTDGVPKKFIKPYMKYILENVWTSI